MSVDVLEVKLGISGEAAVVGGLNRVRRAEDDAVSGSDNLGKAMAAMEIPALRAVAAVQGLAFAISGIAAGAVALTGLKLAATYERMEVGFASLLKSAGAARSLMANLRQMGAQTDYNTPELVKFSRGLLATDSSAHKAANTLRTLHAVTDAMAASGGDVSDVGEVINKLGEMRISPHIDMESIMVLARRGINIPEVYKAATGKNVSQQIAIASLSHMRGQQAFDTIIKGMEKVYGGAAIRNAGTALGLLQNILESLGNVALPTGVALLTIIKPFATVALMAIGAAQHMNEMTLGIAGLITIAVLIVRGWTLISNVAIAAYTATRQLTTALMEYAAAARVATGAAGAAGAGAVGTAVAAGAGATGAAATGAAATGIMGVLGRIGAFLKGPFGLAVVGLIVAMIGGKLQESKSNAYKNTGDFLSNIGAGISLGAGLGAIIGSVVPVVGTVLGGIAGAIIGGIGMGLKTWFDKAHEGPAQADNGIQEQQLQVLREIRGNLIGGGDRANRVKSELEAEHALHHAIFGGYG